MKLSRRSVLSVSRWQAAVRRIGKRLVRPPRAAARFRAAFPVRPAQQVHWPTADVAHTKSIEDFGLDLRLTSSVKEEMVINRIRQYGIVVIDGFLTRGEIAKAVNLFASFDATNSYFVPLDPSKIFTLQGDHLTAALKSPVLARIAADPLVVAAANDFYGDENWRLSAVYGLSYLAGRSGDVSYHIDPSAVLKALIYLSDVTDDDGPFQVDIGSHREGFYRMLAHYYEGEKRAYEVPRSEIRQPGKVLGKAGTMILFNSALIHRAGNIALTGRRASLTYFFDRPQSDDSNMDCPPFLYARTHQSLERAYVQE